MEGATSGAISLPPARSDIGLAIADYDACGVAVLAAALPGEAIAEALASVRSLAAWEQEEGCALLVPGGSQRIYGLIQKAPVFRRLASDAVVLALAHHILGPRIVLYSMQAHIVAPGGDMDPHFDQLEMQPLLPFPVLAALVVMLDDFTLENGATRIAVATRVTTAGETSPQSECMVPLTGRSGTLAAYDGLLWHSTGVNRTDAPRHALLLHYCLPWVRQHENYQRTITTAMARDMTPELRDLLGIHENLYGRRWHSATPGHRPRHQRFDFDY